MSWHPSSVPTIVAEALRPVRDPLRTALRPGPPAPAGQVVRSLVAGVAPARAADQPPDWLYDGQRYAYARAIAALRRFRGALLAEPTGSGKTFIALAVARAFQRPPVACLVPAALAAQWRATAATLGVSVVIGSHEQASRGRLPRGTRGLVLIDESHHFRHPDIRRYAHVADFLVGRPALLLTATPVVNRIEDLSHQLRLAVRDDALAGEGLISLLGLERGGRGALAAVVISSAHCPGVPARAHRTVTPDDTAGEARVLAAMDRLALSSDPSIAGLIRAVLLRAMASSPGSLHGALRRYRRLLLQAADAAAGGRAVSRSAIRAWAGASGDQLILWSLMPDDKVSPDLMLGDAEPLEPLLAMAAALVSAPDPKLGHLRELLSDGARTLVFTGARDTVSYLRRRLEVPTAWCTGERSGIGPTTVSRAAVLARFAPGARGGPHVLLATDVAAEGLDLQGAERVVHYDLPWTATRLAQREGRVARLGSRHQAVDVVRFDPSAALERRLRQLDALARSASAPVEVGFGETDIWRWRDAVARRFGDTPAAAGVACIASPNRGVLAGVTLCGVDPHDPHRQPGALLWLGANGNILRDPEWLVSRLAEASSAQEAPVDESRVSAAIAALTAEIAAMLRRVGRMRWQQADSSGGAAAVRDRLTALARDAARKRDRPLLARLDGVLAVAAGGHTAGEIRLLGRLAHVDDASLMAALSGLPPAAAEPRNVEARISGVIVFGPAAP